MLYVKVCLQRDCDLDLTIAQLEPYVIVFNILWYFDRHQDHNLIIQHC